MPIKFLITGGTIDDLEYEFEKDAPANHNSLIPNILKHCGITSGYSVEELMQKDSRHVNEADRNLILAKCIEATEDKIIITHGTLTMPITAKFLGEKKIPKTIVLLGSMVPANKENSDALFNLGAAVSAVQLLPHGAYITMNGKIFSWENVKKNIEKGIFEKEVID